jgi:diguanylate cyclase (GGDEF)-like protein
VKRRVEDRVAGGSPGGSIRKEKALPEEMFDRAFEVIGMEPVAEDAEDGPSPDLPDRGSVLLLRSTDGEQGVLVAVTAIEPVEVHTEAQVARAAAEWRERWLRLWKRSQLPGKLIAFFEDLGRTGTPQEVCGVLSRHAVELVGGYAAVVLLPEFRQGTVVDGGSRTVVRQPRFRDAGLVAAPDLGQLADPWWVELVPWLADPEIELVAHVPFGDGVLLVAERRSDRVFDVDDWEVLGTLAEQGVQALERVREREEMQKLALHDPLTGLANRRQMEVVLKHAWAAAERGEGLAMMMMDLDGFKALNDGQGHAVGDQVLCIAADCLRQEARGSDVIVRYGGDEFLVILPRGTAEGARALAERVRRRLEGWVEVTTGVAVYHQSYVTAADLIDAADQDMYRSKATRPGKLCNRADIPQLS